MPGISLEIRRKCKICGKVFLVKKLDSQYCSAKCREIAYKRKCDAEKKETRLQKIASQVPKIREYISVKEAVAIFGVERDSVYRLVRSGKVNSVNLGKRLIRINRKDMEALLPTRKKIRKEREKPLPKLYSLEPEDCYTINEVCKKYLINDSTVWAHVRKYSIPSRQIGNYVYVPKEDIDNLYKSDIL